MKNKTKLMKEVIGILLLLCVFIFAYYGNYGVAEPQEEWNEQWVCDEYEYKIDDSCKHHNGWQGHVIDFRGETGCQIGADTDFHGIIQIIENPCVRQHVERCRDGYCEVLE